jgi:hypothetical protein
MKRLFIITVLFRLSVSLYGQAFSHPVFVDSLCPDNVAAYKEQTLKVTLVPLQGVPVPIVRELQDELNRIYRQAVVQWEVSVDGRLQSYSQPVAIADDLNSDVPYSESMESVIAAFNQGKRDKKTWYIFLLPKFSNESVQGMVLGYMPYYLQYGFVEYRAGQTLRQLARTIAHELGHGAFMLRHTFPPSEYNIENRYGNLMGYSDSTHLAKFQWDEIHNSNAGSKEFENADEAMASFIIIDDKHTKLFNHVYDKNLKSYNTTDTTSYKTMAKP